MLSSCSYTYSSSYFHIAFNPFIPLPVWTNVPHDIRKFIIQNFPVSVYYFYLLVARRDESVLSI